MPCPLTKSVDTDHVDSTEQGLEAVSLMVEDRWALFAEVPMGNEAKDSTWNVDKTTAEIVGRATMSCGRPVAVLPFAPPDRPLTGENVRFGLCGASFVASRKYQ